MKVKHQSNSLRDWYSRLSMFRLTTDQVFDVIRNDALTLQKRQKAAKENLELSKALKN